MRIRAAVLRHPSQPVVVEDVELDPPKASEVLVKVVAAGVCHSDVRYADGDLGAGRWPMVLGHEGAGVVEAVGEGVTHVAPGEHVVFCFVPEHHRPPSDAEVAVGVAHVGMAHARCGHLHQHLVRLRRVELDLLHGDGLARMPENGRADLHAIR